MTRAEWIIVGAIGSLCVFVAFADHANRKEREAERATEIRSIFEFGFRVGETSGGCKTLKAVSDNNQDSDWARSGAVRAALESCEQLPARPEIVVRGEEPFAVREK